MTDRDAVLELREAAGIVADDDFDNTLGVTLLWGPTAKALMSTEAWRWSLGLPEMGLSESASYRIAALLCAADELEGM